MQPAFGSELTKHQCQQRAGHPLEFLVTRPAGSAKAVPLGGPMGPPAGPAGAGPGPPQRVPVVGSIPATTQARGSERASE